MQEVESLDLDSIEAQSPQSHRTTPNGHFSGHHQLHLETRRRSSLEQEVTLLRDENETLNSSLSMKEEEMHKLKASFMGIRDERDKLRKKVMLHLWLYLSTGIIFLRVKLSSGNEKYMGKKLYKDTIKYFYLLKWKWKWLLSEYFMYVCGYHSYSQINDQ